MSVPIKENFIFVWEIENFMSCLLNDGKILKSPLFVAKAFKETAWFLYIGIGMDKKYISCYLKRTKFLQNDLSIIFSIKPIKSDNEILPALPKCPRIFSKETPSWGYNQFFEIDKLAELTGPLIIRCIIALPHSAAENFRCKGRTKIAVDRSYFHWNVKETESSWKASKTYPCSSSAHMEIILTASEDEDFVNIIIKKLGEGKPETHYVSCKLSLLDLKEVEQDSRKTEHVFKHNNDTWQFPNFLQKSKLQAKENNYLKNYAFTLLCMFSISNGDSIEYIELYDNNKLVSVHSSIEEDSVSDLQRDLKRMFTYHLLTDVNLRAENRTFPVHKSILSARSPVFAAMFRQDILENQTGVVDILDVDAEIIESFLEFMYTGAVDNLAYESASKLLILADKYQVSSLKKKCSSFLMLNLSISHVCDVVLLANMIGDKVLKAYAMDYIGTHANIIFISEGWSRCIQNDIKLAKDILNNLSINVETKI